MLLSLLDAAQETHCRAIIDARLDLPIGLPAGMVAMSVAPTPLGRLMGEWQLRHLAGPGDVVLCFGNLPPLFNVSAQVRVFLQNRYLLGRRELSKFTWGARLRIVMEQYWLRSRLQSTAQLIVQTPSMAREVEAELGVKARIMPFSPNRLPITVKKNCKRYDFLYVASGEPHKNHKNLVEAWKLLAKGGLLPSLCLTLDSMRDRALLGWIEAEARSEGLKIENAGYKPREELEQSYAESAALIYPSIFESFGLPLLEASAIGLPILAPEIDYVRDVSVPTQTFDPTSPVSIARAVRRHLGAAESPAKPISPATFLLEVQCST